MARFKWDNIILFTEQLATAAQLNLPLNKAVSSMSNETRERAWRAVQRKVADDLASGTSLSQAMDTHPLFFPAMLRRLVRLGEEGDALPAMLRRASQSLQSTREIRQKLLKTLIYPFIIWTILLIEVAIILAVVVPLLSGMASDRFDVDLLDNFFWRLGPVILIFGDAVLLYLSWLVISAVGTEVEGRPRLSRFADWMVTRLPLIGTLHRHSRSMELCETLGILVASGKSAEEAVKITRDTLYNPVLREGLQEIDTAFLAGEEYTGSSGSTLIPHTTLWMLASSSNSPELGNSLLNLAEQHRRQLEALSNLVREMLEPILLLAIALSAGLMLVAFYISLFSISTNFINSIRF